MLVLVAVISGAGSVAIAVGIVGGSVKEGAGWGVKALRGATPTVQAKVASDKLKITTAT